MWHAASSAGNDWLFLGHPGHRDTAAKRLIVLLTSHWSGPEDEWAHEAADLAPAGQYCDRQPIRPRQRHISARKEGTRMERTTKVSRSTPTASAKPISTMLRKAP